MNMNEGDAEITSPQIGNRHSIETTRDKRLLCLRVNYRESLAGMGQRLALYKYTTGTACAKP
jgi:hypothetical protein